MDGDEYIRCSRCGYGGCDVRVSACGCSFHSRCFPLLQIRESQACPNCHKNIDSLVLFPVTFREIDDALRTALALAPSATLSSSNNNNNRKRKGGSGGGGDDVLEAAVNPLSSFTERRTGRWTVEEMAYCDRLIAKFSFGDLPLVDNVKLNEFLGNMLKSKQSRLTKKMKNAKLSSKTYARCAGCIHANEAREMSSMEESFFNSIVDFQERAEVKFHMQKEWREHFSRLCADIGQILDADAWLSSVEEMDRRSSRARDSARMAKRKLMMGVALRADTKNLEQGVFIEKTEADIRAVASKGALGTEENFFDQDMLSIFADDKNSNSAEQSSLLHSSPFLAKVTAHLMRHSVPFEHVDLWVPSFVPGDDTQGDVTACRLCYAGGSTTEKLVSEDGLRTRVLTAEEKFNFFSFGDYSQKFSFNVGSGLPGRVYESGRPTWEQSVNNAPHHHFERCGGANQWGIKSVVGILVASPNVGRIVVVIYSCFDRSKDEGLVARLCEEFTKLMPSPKWKLVVDIGEAEEEVPAPRIDSSVLIEQESTENATFSSAAKDNRIDQVVALLGKYMPSDPMSPLAPYVSGFMSLRLLLLRITRTVEEEELIRTMMDSYSSYASGGREQSDIAVMLARDFLYVSGAAPSTSYS